MAQIVAVCWSEKKGTVKEPINDGLVQENFGLAGDAHADCSTNRQVSLIAIESINRMQKKGYNVVRGSFAENLTTEGIDLVSLPIGAELCVGQDIILEVTQIGKECHTGCAVMQQVGKCIMPKEGVFTKVIRGGRVKVGDEIKVEENS
jgi:MOSC domain-containing protein YiiM|tara:strand:- start:189 stop:632 length:444 start_codon:yes stop_codon:yes gene_type:complete